MITYQNYMYLDTTEQCKTNTYQTFCSHQNANSLCTKLMLMPSITNDKFIDKFNIQK